MSRTLTLVGRSSQLEADIVPAEIQLDRRYGVALVGFYTYNSIPNIEEGKNNFYYWKNGERKCISIDEGTYEISDIEKFLQASIASDVDKPDEVFSLKPNNNTLKCEIRSIYEVDSLLRIPLLKYWDFPKED